MSNLIEDGSLARLLLVVIVFGGLVLLEVLGRPFDERLFDLCFVIVSFYFGVTVGIRRERARQNGSSEGG